VIPVDVASKDEYNLHVLESGGGAVAATAGAEIATAAGFTLVGPLTIAPTKSPKLNPSTSRACEKALHLASARHACLHPLMSRSSDEKGALLMTALSNVLH